MKRHLSPLELIFQNFSPPGCHKGNHLRSDYRMGNGMSVMHLRTSASSP
jgi:hypothetical protein